jgi:hypothetical protein
MLHIFPAIVCCAATVYVAPELVTDAQDAVEDRNWLRAAALAAGVMLISAASVVSVAAVIGEVL